jgi:hypothetical protein
MYIPLYIRRDFSSVQSVVYKYKDIFYFVHKFYFFLLIMLSRIRVAHYVVRGPIAIFLLPLVYALYILLNGCVFA